MSLSSRASTAGSARGSGGFGGVTTVPASRMLFSRTQKAFMEEAMVRRREAERQRTEYWDGAAKYFDRVDRNNGRHEAWSSDKAYRTRYIKYYMR